MKTILVIEDDRSLARLTELNLTAEGYHIVVCHEGGAAMAALQQSTPDLILLDLKLPTTISGWDLLAYLRRDDRLHDVPVIVLSAFAHEQDKNQAAAFGANDYLVKPFGIAELLDHVGRLVAGDEAKR
jgi:DNA-binding response OmpR family regulator